MIRVKLRCAISIAVVTGMVGGAALSAMGAADNPGGGEAWSTKKVMDKVHVGKQALLSVVRKDLQKADPDWNGDEHDLTEIIRLMNMLRRQKPPRGSQEAWNKLVQDYVDGARAARRNVKKHRLKPARTALAKVSSTCEECHDNHGIQ